MWNPFRIFSEHDHHWQELDHALTEAFEKIKSEKRLTFSWLNYFRKKEQENEKTHQQIQHELGKHDAKIEALKDEIKELKENVKTAQNTAISAQVRTKSGPESGLVSEPKNRSASEKSFVSKIASMIRPQRKEYIMQKILDLVERGGYTTKQVETVIVKEKQLCGRTAFYDYMKELKYQGLIKNQQKNGRKVLISA
ncbi:hypothetical protein CMO88_00715 [Candidatus Woesearchaeota archaeon]|nr:hypothetical protein [Candidatus Woesearchaeota archaeon]|tara:strand:- start:1804 stop:2391 length:588 start_codon:yes stop_codon:yes gene_type:complete